MDVVFGGAFDSCSRREVIERGLCWRWGSCAQQKHVFWRFACGRVYALEANILRLRAWPTCVVEDRMSVFVESEWVRRR